MARETKIHQPTSEIEAPPDDARPEPRRRVLTPELELRLLVEDLHRETRGHDPRAVARDVEEAVREARRGRERRR